MRVEPARKIAGEVSVPGDKSISHRAVLVSAICEGETTIRGFGRSADTEATIGAVRALGVRVDEIDETVLLVHEWGFGACGLQSRRSTAQTRGRSPCCSPASSPHSPVNGSS